MLHRFIIFTACLLSVTTLARAELRLPSVISSHMVIQRGRSAPIWGWADAGEEVTVTLAGQTKTTKANDKGRWSIELDALDAGGPHEMSVATGDEVIKLSNVLIGEVWVCAGQSNMEWSVAASDNPRGELETADLPKIRLFKTPHRPAGMPEDDISAVWQVCSPQTARDFSAVAFFFGRRLHKELDGVPIGLIQCAWGGTRIEPWIPRQGFTTDPSVKYLLDMVDKAQADYDTSIRQNLAALEKWLAHAKRAADAGEHIPALPAGVSKHPLADARNPTGLYNGMVAPIVPFAMRGVIWYQGESNVGMGMQYRDLMQALIAGWRDVWKQGDFPFYYVQLAPWERYADGALPRLWEAQTAALKIRNTGMVVTTDIGDVQEIHPRNKQDVGKRLALWALAKTYGRDVVFSGPLFKEMTIENGKATITFDHVGGGLTARGGDGEALSHFEIAGVDKMFHPATAKIEGDTIVLQADAVTEPVAVRFGFSKTAQPNLMNKEGLPASPFRTDDWE